MCVLEPLELYYLNAKSMMCLTFIESKEHITFQNTGPKLTKCRTEVSPSHLEQFSPGKAFFTELIFSCCRDQSGGLALSE